MNFETLAKERYSVRKFSDQKIEKDLLNKVLLAGCVAPTACNNQPQKVYVLESTDADLTILGSIGEVLGQMP